MAQDGHIYGLTSLYSQGGAYNHFFINTEWIQNLNLTVPKTIEEYTNVLRAFRDNDPNQNSKKDEIPLSFSGAFQLNWLAGAFGIRPHDNGIYTEGDKIMYGFTDERFREYLRWLNTLYKEGLLDSASFSQESAQINAKGSDGILGSFFGALNVDSTVGKEMASQYEYLAPLIGPNGDRGWNKESDVRTRSCFVITSENPYPEATMRWIDHLYSMEGAYMFNFGVEDKNYKKLDNGYYSFLIPEQYSTKLEYRCKEISPADGAIPMGSFDWREFGKVMEEDLPYYETLKKRDEAYKEVAKIRYPVLYFSEEQNREVSAISADLAVYVENMHARFIIGDVDLDSGWDSYCKTVNDIGAGRFVELYQDVFDKRNQK